MAGVHSQTKMCLDQRIFVAVLYTALGKGDLNGSEKEGGHR